MSVDLSIHYKDTARPPYSHPFSGNRVLQECWRPLAERFGLKTLTQMEDLWIYEQAEAEQFAAELRVVERHLRQLDRAYVPLWETNYMLERLAILLPVIDQAISEWDQVKVLSV